MLSHSLRKQLSSLAKDLKSRMADVEARVSKALPPSTLVGTPFHVTEPTPPKTMDQRLAELDSKIANIEALREAGRPEEIRIKNLPMKYGRAGRHPAYPWYGSSVAYHEKVPYLADRLGSYSRMGAINTELHDWLQAKSDQNNPLFQSFFCQEPTREPDPDVDFEKGEVIYENHNAFRGTVLAKQTMWTGLGYIVFNMLHTVLTGRTVYPIGTEGMDQRDDGYNSGTNWVTQVYQNYGDWHDLETFSGVGFISPLAPLAGVAAVSVIQSLTKDVCAVQQEQGPGLRQQGQWHVFPQRNRRGLRNHALAGPAAQSWHWAGNSVHQGGVHDQLHEHA
jgi:hypothetical protein